MLFPSLARTLPFPENISFTEPTLVTDIEPENLVPMLKVRSLLFRWSPIYFINSH